jgi:hypothetical protein
MKERRNMALKSLNEMNKDKGRGRVKRRATAK